jgi:GrpB-like predicted nucleotidyltransferase (UPF0157 family)
VGCPYDPQWPVLFSELHDRIWPTLRDVALAVEHVGSTAVPGLAAKPVIDLDVVVASRREVPLAIARLADLGYEHRGNLGIEDREAFVTPAALPAHHLYVCPHDSVALRNHLVLRDHLRSHPSDAAAYGQLKIHLAQQFPDDIAAYVEGKTEFILSILARYGFAPDTLESIRRANRP